ncbi:MAG: DoxX family protein [bacterium]|nr:DoxX family protein [bacterium]
MQLTSTRFTDAGILLIRIVISAMMIIFHGYSKITAGPQLWEKIGKSMSPLGVDFFPVFWGFMAAVSEFIIPMFIIAGILFRPSVLMLAFTMIVAMSTHFIKMDQWAKIEYPLALFAVLIGLFLTGPGKYSLQYLLSSKKSSTDTSQQIKH